MDMSQYYRKGYMVAGQVNPILMRAPNKHIQYGPKDKHRILEMTGETYDAVLARYLERYPEERERILNPKPRKTIKQRFHGAIEWIKKRLKL